MGPLPRPLVVHAHTDTRTHIASGKSGGLYSEHQVNEHAKTQEFLSTELSIQCMGYSIASFRLKMIGSLDPSPYEYHATHCFGGGLLA